MISYLITLISTWDVQNVAKPRTDRQTIVPDMAQTGFIKPHATNYVNNAGVSGTFTWARTSRCHPILTFGHLYPLIILVNITQIYIHWKIYLSISHCEGSDWSDEIFVERRFTLKWHKIHLIDVPIKVSSISPFIAQIQAQYRHMIKKQPWVGILSTSWHE